MAISAELIKDLRQQSGVGILKCKEALSETDGNLEKELGFKTKREVQEYGVENFVYKCKERVKKYSNIQTSQSLRLGYWMDWDNSYYTMSDENNYTIWAFLKKLFNDGKIYQGSDVGMS